MPLTLHAPPERNPPVDPAQRQEVKALIAQENREQVGARIRQIREHRGLLRYQLAERVGKSPAYIGQIESGLKGYSVATLEALAEALGVTPDIILCKKEMKLEDLAG